METPQKSFRELESWIQSLLHKETSLKREATDRDTVLKKLHDQLDQQKQQNEALKRDAREQFERQKAQSEKDLRAGAEATRKTLHDYAVAVAQSQRAERELGQLSEEREHLLNQIDAQKEEIARLKTAGEGLIKAGQERDEQIRRATQSAAKTQEQLEVSQRSLRELEEWVQNMLQTVDSGSWKKNSAKKRAAPVPKGRKSSR